MPRVQSGARSPLPPRLSRAKVATPAMEVRKVAVRAAGADLEDARSRGRPGSGRGSSRRRCRRCRRPSPLPGRGRRSGAGGCGRAPPPARPARRRRARLRAGPAPRRSTTRKASVPPSSSARITAPAIIPGRVPSTSRRVSGPASRPSRWKRSEGAGDRDQVVEQVGRRDRRARRPQDAGLDRNQEDRSGDADGGREDGDAEGDQRSERGVGQHGGPGRARMSSKSIGIGS